MYPPKPSVPHRRAGASFCTLLLAWLLLLPAHAQSTGEIRGRVVDAATGAPLNNARITAVGTDLEAFADEGGQYRLGGLPAGPVELMVAFTGYVPQLAAVIIEAGAVVRRDFDVSLARTEGAGDTVLALDKFTVESEMLSAQARALNEQRYSPNIRNVVSADEYGDIGAGNIGEFVKFIPGVDVEYSASAARGISVRGFPSANTLVTIDGGGVASATTAGEGRNVELDALRLNNISRIEVTKVPTPDLPANAQGGGVNVISKSGFERRRPELSYRLFTTFNSQSIERLGLSENAGAFRRLNASPVQTGFDFSYLRPVSPSFAFTFTGGSNARFFEFKEVAPTWNLVSNTLAQVDIVPAHRHRRVTTGSLGGEWRISDNSVLSANLMYTDTTLLFHDSRLALAFGAGATGDARFVQGAPNGVGTATMSYPQGRRNDRTHQANLRYQYRQGPWKANVSGFTSKSRTFWGDRDGGVFAGITSNITGLVIRGEGLDADHADRAFRGLLPQRVTATTAAGASVDVFDGGMYSINTAISNQRYLNDKKIGLKADVQREFDGPGRLVLKAGVAIDRQERDLRRDYAVWDFRPSLPAADRRAGHYNLIDSRYSSSVQRYYPQNRPQWISLEKLHQLSLTHPDYFVRNEVTTHTQNVLFSKRLEETISAAYVRADLKFWENRLWVVGGVRFEETADEGEGPRNDIRATFVQDANGNLVRTPTGALIPVSSDPLETARLRYVERGAQSKRSYRDYYPSLNTSYSITESLILRAAYARTIGRPNLSFILPGMTIASPTAAEASRIITVVNTGLKPWTSDGFDLTIESYAIKGGTGSIGVFSKQIKNFFGQVRTDATPELLAQYGLSEEYLDYDMVFQENVGDAEIKGFEASYRQSLVFLPSWGRRFQVFANGTWLDLKGPNSANFSGYSPRTINYGITFARRKVRVQLNWNHKASARLTLQAAGANYPAGTYNWRAARTVVSGSFEYQISKRLSLYGTATNLGDKEVITQRIAPNTPDYAKTVRMQSYGIDCTFGIKGTF